MKKMLKSRLGRRILFFALLLILALAAYSYWDANEFDVVWDHGLPDCHQVPGVVGAEDLVEVDQGSRLLVSADDRQNLHHEFKPGIYLYDGKAQPTLVTAIEGHPHGITSLVTESGEQRVFVIVHKPDRNDEVQVYSWKDDKLTPVQTVAFEGVNELNGIVALDANRFYVTQDLGAKSAVGKEAEQALKIAGGKILFYDGKNVDVMDEHLVYPDGLQLSPDKKILYATELLGRTILVYDRQEGTSKLTLRKKIPIPTSPDNLKWTKDGRLLTGSHPHLLQLFLHVHNATRFHTPAQVIAIAGLPDKPSFTEIYSSKEGPVGGVTTAIALGNRLVMGAVNDEGLLDCSNPQ